MVSVKLTPSIGSQISRIQTLKQELTNKINDLQKEQKRFQTIYLTEVEKVVKSPLISSIYAAKVASALIEMQSAYYGGAGSTVLAEDKTQFNESEVIQKTTQHVVENFQKASVDLNSGDVTVTLVTDSFMGVGSSDDSTGPGVPWLHYFVYGGLDNNLVWINNETYELLKNDSAGSLGRFGNGYMWHVNDVKAFNGRLKSAGSSESYASLKVPFGNSAPKDWFGEIWETTPLYPLVHPIAIESTKLILSKSFKF